MCTRQVRHRHLPSTFKKTQSGQRCLAKWRLASKKLTFTLLPEKGKTRGEISSGCLLVSRPEFNEMLTEAPQLLLQTSWIPIIASRIDSQESTLGLTTEKTGCRCNSLTLMIAPILRFVQLVVASPQFSPEQNNQPEHQQFIFSYILSPWQLHQSNIHAEYWSDNYIPGSDIMILGVKPCNDSFMLHPSSVNDNFFPFRVISQWSSSKRPMNWPG